MKSKVIDQDGLARVLAVETAGGNFMTPAFMPVATHGAIKTLTRADIKELGAEIILSNTYHLYLRPGEKLIKSQGGLASFTGFKGATLTDSGGFQVFSLGHKQRGKLAKVTDKGVTFKSHLDGSMHLFTPKKVLQIQQDLGVDIMMPLDDCPPGDASKVIKKESLRRTHLWLKEAVTYWQEKLKGEPALFGIVQGADDLKLREESINEVTSYPLSGFALGGLAVGEGKESLYRTVAFAAPKLPSDKPRYLMGVGPVNDLLWAVGHGIDMFDCVIPTRFARHGSVWLLSGDKKAIAAFWEERTEDLLKTAATLTVVRESFPKEKYAKKADQLQPESLSAPAGYLTYSYANHLAKEREVSLSREFSRHNLKLLLVLTRHMRVAIKLKRYRDLAKLFGVLIP